MNRHLKLFIKLFLVSGFIFGAATGLFFSFEDAVYAGLIYGGTMTPILGLLHVWKVKKLPSGGSADAFRVRHVRYMDLPVSVEKAFDLCIESLCTIRKIKIRDEDHSRGEIVAKAGITFDSWGELIVLKVYQTGKEGVEIEISSRPVMAGTVIDCGKNLENVEKIVECIKSKSEGPARLLNYSRPSTASRLWNRVAPRSRTPLV